METVKELRVKKGLSLAELSEKTGIKYQTLYRIELRESIPTLDIAFKIAEGLGVSVYDVKWGGEYN